VSPARRRRGRFARALLVGPDAVARAAAAGVRRPQEVWLLRQPRRVRGSYAREVLDAGGWPVIVTHWQSMFSNGTETGLAVLDEVGRRVARSLKDEVKWMTCMEIARQRVGERA